MTDGNYLFTYFEGDKQMLYFLFENSTIELMNYFKHRIMNMSFWKNKGQI